MYCIMLSVVMGWVINGSILRSHFDKVRDCRISKLTMTFWDFETLIFSWYYFDIIRCLLIYLLYAISRWYFDITKLTVRFEDFAMLILSWYFDIIKCLLMYLSYAISRWYFDIIMIFWYYNYEILRFETLILSWYYFDIIKWLLIYLLNAISRWYFDIIMIFWYFDIYQYIKLTVRFWEFETLISSWYYFDIIKWLLIYLSYAISRWYFDIIMIFCDISKYQINCEILFIVSRYLI